MKSIEKAQLRAYLQRLPMKAGVFMRLKMIIEGSTKFEMYRDFKIRVKDIAPHAGCG